MKKFWQRLVLFGLTGAFFVSCISCSAANTASKVPILMYHNLTNDPSAVTSMTITGERFQEDMEYLEYNGYTPLLSADLINIRAGKEAMPERPVMITFDDGYRSNYDIAYPILQKTGQKNVLFFAYPFGARDAWMQPLLQKNGIQVSVLTNTGTASIRRGLTDLPRYRITMDTKLSDILPANPNASHDITVRAHMPTMIKNEKIRQEVARHLPAQERTIKIPKSYT